MSNFIQIDKQMINLDRVKFVYISYGQLSFAFHFESGSVDLIIPEIFADKNIDELQHMFKQIVQEILEMNSGGIRCRYDNKIHC